MSTSTVKRPCWLEIDSEAIVHNFRLLASLAGPDAELMAIVKANGYGHGLAHTARAAVEAGAGWLGVTSIEEGVETRAFCPEPRILAIGSVFPGQGAEVVAHRITPVVWEHPQLDELEQAARAADLAPGSLPVHLEIDTGMSRQGVTPERIEPILARFTAATPLRLEAVMTHLFAADEADQRQTGLQLEQLRMALEAVRAAGLAPVWLSVGSSAALVGGIAPRLAALAADFGLRLLMRPGLALYGVVPRFDPPFEGAEPATYTRARRQLHPVLVWKSRVAGLRTIEKGDVVGYNGTFVACKPMRVALVAAGYADGVDRHLGNHFAFLVGGQRAPVIGRVSMDHTMIDVSGIEGVAPGDEVVLLGCQGKAQISAQQHADATGTIPWEVFTRIGPRVERTVR